MFVGTGEDDGVRLQTEWGGRYLGVQSHSLATAYCHFALPQRLASILELGRQVERVAGQQPFTWAERERIHLVHWLAVSQVCMLIEEFAALSTAIRRWRVSGADIATTYHDWRGDITEVISKDKLGTTDDWAFLVRYPGHAALRGLGMTAQEADAFSKAVDATFRIASDGG